MAMRVTGMFSGLDTESIIQELVAAKRTKVDDKKKEQTKLEWKQEAWADLNKKIKNFYTKTVGNLRYSDAYNKKTAVLSNSNVADVIAGDNAMLSTQSLEVTQLAKTGYMTGGEISTKSGEKATSGTLATDLGLNVGDSFKINGKEIKIDEKTTLGSLANQLSAAGVTANFDAATQRFFIGATKSGKAADFKISGNNDVLEKLGLAVKADGTGATKVDGQDAEIKLNGATFTSADNTFEINGLTITCKEENKGNPTTLTTKTDTSGIYDMVKNFIKEYSDLINEMDKLYNAESSKGYEPLTDDEKEAMSEGEIEKWETKIKDSLLRHDSTLSTVSTSLKQIMASGFEVNGKKMYLFDFGIETPGYFDAEDNEKNAYYIKGDEDSLFYSSDSNKLKAMIESDPEAVSGFFVELSRSLYSKLTEMTSSVKDYRSYGNVYDDIKMKSDYKDYDSKIKDLESKLKAYEDKWYKKFSAMETAMSKMQSNMNSITGLLGGGSQ